LRRTCAHRPRPRPVRARVLRSASKQRLSRQAVLKITPTAISAAGLSPLASTEGVPRLADPADRARLANHLTGPDRADIRDLTLILNLYWGAFRGSELCAMTRDDTRLVDQGVGWLVRRAKNGQLGHSETVGAARNPTRFSAPPTRYRSGRPRLQGSSAANLAPTNRSSCAWTAISTRPKPSPERRIPDRQTGRPAPPASSPTTPATPYGPGSSATPSTPALPANKSNATAAGPTSEASTPTTARPRPGDRPTLPAPCPSRQGHQLTVHGAVRVTGWSSIASSRSTAPTPGTRTPRRGSGDSPGVPLARR